MTSVKVCEYYGENVQKLLKVSIKNYAENGQWGSNTIL